MGPQIETRKQENVAVDATKKISGMYESLYF